MTKQKVKQLDDILTSDFSVLGTPEQRKEVSFEIMHSIRLAALMYFEENATDDDAINVDATAVVAGASKVIALFLAQHRNNLDPLESANFRKKMSGVIAESVSSHMEALAELEKDEPGYLVNALYSGIEREDGKPLEVVHISKVQN